MAAELDKGNFSIPETDPRHSRTLEVATEATNFFGGEKVISVAFGPGRVELNNHTDNSGRNAKTVSFAIGGQDLEGKPLGTFVAVCERDYEIAPDNTMQIFSKQFPEVSDFNTLDLSNLFPEGLPEDHWSNYIRALILRCYANGLPISACDIYIDSNIPSSGGVSSSAALELASVFALAAAHGRADGMTPQLAAKIGREAEHMPPMKSGCGWLDQATSAMGKDGEGLLLTYSGGKEPPIGRNFKFNNEGGPDGKGFTNTGFVIVTNPELSRQLGQTNYGQMKSDVETALNIMWENGMLENGAGLAEFPADELEEKIPAIRSAIIKHLGEKSDPVIFERILGRIRHGVTENVRADLMIRAAESGDVDAFAALMNAGGRSSIGDHRVAETNTGTVLELPVFLSLMNYIAGKDMGIKAAKNCGGGGNMTSLLMVSNDAIKTLPQILSDAIEGMDAGDINTIQMAVMEDYKTEISYPKVLEILNHLKTMVTTNKLVFTPAVPGPGAGVLYKGW